MSERKEFLKGKKPVTFLDLFAGAGGISEGFLQAHTKNKYYDFVLASDINENCELTHRVRYNVQLGLKTAFITEDIMSDTFLPHLLDKLQGKKIDVVTGGPSCQSFSLSGRRKRFDKRDNLFLHYLKVIRKLRPKYFVMENVKGILTKDKGKFKEAILREIRSIIDDTEIEAMYSYLEGMLSRQASTFVKNCYMAKVKMEIVDDTTATDQKEVFFNLLSEQYRAITSGITYQISKSDKNINTIRHGLSLLRRTEEREKIKAMVINEKTQANVDNDYFVNSLNDFLYSIEDEAIVDLILCSFDNVTEFQKFPVQVAEMKQMVKLYSMSLDETFEELKNLSEVDGTVEIYEHILDDIRLYRIDKPIVALSANYGVPQNRERVLFIGCRKDQTLITEVPATVAADERVTVYEAINDLDFIGNGEVKTKYEPVEHHPEFDGLIRRRKVDGEVCLPVNSFSELEQPEEAKTFSEWSREGRLSDRFIFDCKPFYVRSMDDLMVSDMLRTEFDLFNHQTSDQAPNVKKRLSIIAEFGDYNEACKERLKKEKLESSKRNYTVLNPAGQSPTVVTMPDDFIHYSRFRAMTVREMARLQSFDDSFVFQGKRQTGGEKRKVEIPQYTLVGNAVPPLMSRAIGNTILKVIK